MEEQWQRNNEIKNVESKGDKLIITYTKGSQAEIPSLVNGKPVPLVDPYDKRNGGFMVQNKIMDSYLSEYAKLCFCALRRSIVHKTGFTFVNVTPSKEDQRNLMHFMSVGSKTTVKKALKELAHFRVIDIGDYTFRGARKSIYVFLPESKWKLPNTQDAANEYKQLLKSEEAAKKEAKQHEKEVAAQIEEKQKSGVFVFDYGKHKGLTMEEAYEIDPGYVFKQSREAHTELVKSEAQRVIDEMEEIPI